MPQRSPEASPLLVFGRENSPAPIVIGQVNACGCRLSLQTGKKFRVDSCQRITSTRLRHRVKPAIPSTLLVLCLLILPWQSKYVRERQVPMKKLVLLTKPLDFATSVGQDTVGAGSRLRKLRSVGQSFPKSDLSFFQTNTAHQASANRQAFW